MPARADHEPVFEIAALEATAASIVT